MLKSESFNVICRNIFLFFGSVQLAFEFSHPYNCQRLAKVDAKTAYEANSESRSNNL